MIDINPVSLNTDIMQAVSQNIVFIPAEYFYCPYWLLNIGGFLIFILGFIVGIGSIYGWRKLFFRILTLLNQI